MALLLLIGYGLGSVFAGLEWCLENAPSDVDWIDPPRKKSAPDDFSLEVSD